MLVLSRKLGEQIVIAENIVLTVVDIDRGKVRLGVAAPREVPVHRKEVFDAVQQERKAEDVIRGHFEDTGEDAFRFAFTVEAEDESECKAVAEKGVADAPPV